MACFTAGVTFNVVCAATICSFVKNEKLDRGERIVGLLKMEGHTHTTRNGVCKEVPTAEGSTVIQELTHKGFAQG